MGCATVSLLTLIFAKCLYMHIKHLGSLLRDHQGKLRLAAPFVVDWNGDGYQDLLVGEHDGSVRPA